MYMCVYIYIYLYIYKGPFLQETMASRGKTYNGYPVDADYFGSYSMDSLAMALHSVYHTKSFTAAVARCVNFLGDADSTGAVCGQIAGAFYGLGAIDPRLLEQLGQWDPDSEIALRGALLYALGLDLSPETKEAARERSSSALACDRDEAAEAAELASFFPKPPPLPIDAHPVQQPPKSHSPPLIQGTAAMQAAIYAASMRAKDPNWGSAGRRKDEGLLACTLNADRGQRAPRRSQGAHRAPCPPPLGRSPERGTRRDLTRCFLHVSPCEQWAPRGGAWDFVVYVSSVDV